MISRLDSLLAVGDMRSGAELARRHVPHARAAQDTAFLLELAWRQGAILTNLGRVREAEAVLVESTVLAEARRDSVRLCMALRWLSVALTYQARAQEAAAILERLLAVAEASRDQAHQGWAWVGLGWDKVQRGQLAEAKDDYYRALARFDALDMADGRAFAFNGLGIAHQRLGEYRDALRAWRRSIDIAETVALPSVREFLTGVAINNLAVLEFSFGDPSEAARHFRELYRRATDAGNVREAVVPKTNSALCAINLGRYADAIDELEALTGLCHRHGFRDLQGKAMLRMAACHQSLRRLVPADSILREVLVMGEALPVETRVRALIQLAEVHHAADSSVAALRTLERAADLLAVSPDEVRHRELLAAQGLCLLDLNRPAAALAPLLQVADEEGRLGVTRTSLIALSAAARACRQLGWPDSALVLLERAAHAWESDRGIPLDPEWRERRGADSREVYTDLALALWRDARVDAGTIFDRLQVFKARTLMERVRGPGPGHEFHASDTLATAAELQRDTLASGELMLDAYLGPRVSVLLALTRTECRFIEWPSEEKLATKLRHYHQLLSTPPSPGETLDAGLYDEIRATLRQELLGGVEDLLAHSSRVFVVPDGVLNLLPLATLLSRDPVTEVVRLPSATFLRWSRDRDAGPAPAPAWILAVGGERSRGGQRLPGAADEVRMLARRLRGVDAHIGAASRERLVACDLLHVAAHAEVNDRNPWRSMIVLDADRPETWLHADQIAGLRMAARLAVLSSCESARGWVLSGEGVLGLCQAFLSAGVPAVIATLWPVDDHAALHFMRCFYGALESASSPARALCQAQQDLRAEATFAHPYYWAGYVIVGASDDPLGLAPRPWIARLGGGSVAGLGALVVLALLAVRRRRG